VFYVDIVDTSVSMWISSIAADPHPQADASAVRTSVIVMHCLLHDQVS